MIVILLISLKRESEGVGWGSFQEDNRIHVYEGLDGGFQKSLIVEIFAP